LNTLRSLNGGMHSHAHCRCNRQVYRGNDNDFEMFKTYKTTLSATTILWQAIVCYKMDDDLWHQYDCLMGLCTKYQVSELQLCQFKLQPLEEFVLNYKCFEKIDIGQG
jgi:hypothetical protein